MRALWVRSVVLVGSVVAGIAVQGAYAQSAAQPALSPEREANVRRLLQRPRVGVGPPKRTARVEGTVRPVSDPQAEIDDAVQGSASAYDWFSAPPYGMPNDMPSVGDRDRLLPKPEHARRGYEPLEEVERLYPGPHGLGNNGVGGGAPSIGQWGGWGGWGSPYGGAFGQDQILTQEYMRARTRGAFNADDMRTRRDRVLKRADRAIEEGRSLLREGRYRQAAMMLRLASDLDQGDPGVRVYLAAALLGSGRYEEGGAVIRRALSLQPKLVNLPVDWSRDFSSPDELRSAIAKLQARCLGNPGESRGEDDRSAPIRRESDDAITVRRGGAARDSEQMVGITAGDLGRISDAGPNALVLLGYAAYQQGDDVTAYAALWEAWRAGARDDAVKALMDLTRPE